MRVGDTSSKMDLPTMEDIEANQARSKEEPLLPEGDKSPFYDFDEVEELPQQKGGVVQSSTDWKKIAGRVGFAIGAAAFLAVRCQNISFVANGIASFGMGFCVQAGFEYGFKGKGLVQVQKSMLPPLGQCIFFLASQIEDNVDNGGVQEAATQFMIALGGANLEAFFHRIWDQRFLKVESHAFRNLNEERFEKLFSKPVYLQALKVAIAAGSLLGYLLSDDPMLKMASLFITCYSAAHGLVGENIAEYIDRKIEQKDAMPIDDSLIEGSCSPCLQYCKAYFSWRFAKTCLSTIGWVAIPALFIPWNTDAHSDARVAQLPFFGAVAGVFDGIAERFFENRLEKVPVKRLEELQILNLPGSTEYKDTGIEPLRYKAFRIYRVAFPVIVMSLLTGFFIWQEGWDLKSNVDKGCLGAMYGGFLAGLGTFNYIDRTWDPDKRDIIKDKLMTSLILKNRVFGANPIYYYLVVQNAISISSKSLAEFQGNPTYVALSTVGWVFYGWTMAFELMRTNWRRRGTLDQNAMMVLINAALTAKVSMTGKLPWQGG